MKIDDVQIVYPYVQYNVIVSHNTPRIPTAIEWLILEVISKCSKLKDYAKVPVGTFFSTVFFISDVDKLIKPCLVSLRDMDIIKASNLYDDLSLDNVYLSELALTDDGKMFVASGTLPTKISQDSFDIVYDVYNNELMEQNSKLLKTKPQGFFIGDLEGYNSKVDTFPEGIVLDRLNRLKTLDYKQRAGCTWLNPSTSITELQSSLLEKFYKIVNYVITITEDGKLEIADLKDKELAQCILENKYANSELPQAKNLNQISIQDWDSEINEVFPLEQIATKIQSRIPSQSVYVIQNDTYNRLRITKSIGAQLKTCIIVGAEAFSVSFTNNNFIIKVQEALLDPETLYQDLTRNICQGLFALHNDKQYYRVPFGFIPVAPSNNLQQAILPLVEEYFSQNYHLILLYLQLNRSDLFKEQATRYLETLNNLEKQIAFIEEMNSITDKAFNKKYLSNDVTTRFLIDNVVNGFDGRDIQDVISFFEEKNKQDIYVKNDYLYTGLLKGILPKIKDVPSYVDLQKLWVQLYKLDKKKLSFVRNSKLYKNMYGDATFKSYIDDFVPQKDYVINPTCTMPIDDVFVKLKRIENLIVGKLMPTLLDYGQLSDELSKKFLGKNYADIDGINNNLNNWENELLKLEEYGFDIKCYEDSYFAKCNDAFIALGRNIGYFYDDKVDKFSKLYIADTCALMKHPELIDAFLNGKNMLIISRVVLQELDGLKEDRDEAVAYDARRAINKIGECRGCEWLNLSENFDPAYLPQELDAKVKDNQILSIGVKYYRKQPVFISDDNNACNVAVSLKLRTMSSEDFLDSNIKALGKNGKKDKKRDTNSENTSQNNTANDEVYLSADAAIHKVDKNKPINANDLAKELGLSLFELNKRYSSKINKITNKTVINPKNANMIRKDFQKK